MKNMKQKLATAGSVAALLTLAAGTGASALATSPSAETTTDQTRVKLIISRGDLEINRRLTTLAKLSSKISNAAKLSASDKSTLNAEVSSEVSGLTALKSQLDAATTLDAAKADAKSIVSDYRVYALIVPKIELVRVADDQQVIEGKLSTLAAKLQTRLASAQNSGKDVTTLQNELKDMETQTANAEAISVKIESSVIDLQPTDYNSDHSLLSGDAAQLKTARAYNVAAYNDAKAIIGSLKNL